MKVWYLLPLLGIMGFQFISTNDDDPATKNADTALRILRQNPKEAVSFVQDQGTTAYDFGMKLRSMGRNDDALLWFVELTKAFDDERYFFGKAWLHWQRGEVDQAVRDGLALLDHSPSPLIQARTNYMLGMVELQNDQLGSAEAYFSRSGTQYEDLGKNGGQYLVLMGRAMVAIRQESYHQAQQLINQALEFNSKMKRPYSLGRAYELESEIAFQKQDYKEALRLARLSEEKYVADKIEENAMWARIKQALCLALLDDFDAAYDLAVKNDEVIQKQNLVKQSHYNNIAWIYMKGCQGYDYSPMKSDLESWVEKNEKEGVYLKRLLHHIEERLKHCY